MAMERNLHSSGDDSWQFSPDSYTDSFFKSMASFHRPQMNSIVFEKEAPHMVESMPADAFHPMEVPVHDRSEIRRSSLTMMLNDAQSSIRISSPTNDLSPRTVTEVPPSAAEPTMKFVLSPPTGSKWEKILTATYDTDSDSDSGDESGDDSSVDASPNRMTGCHPSVFTFFHDQYMRSAVKKVACLNFDLRSTTMSQLRRLHEKTKKKENRRVSQVRFDVDGDGISGTYPMRQQIPIVTGREDQSQQHQSADDNHYFMMSL